jgi:3-deoxy-D-manno-octulosonic-acid transferase
MLAYSALLTLALVLSSPWWLARMLTTQRYREGLAERLGRVPQRLRKAIQADGPERRIIWIHAVSVGEVLATTRLVRELEAALQVDSDTGFRIVVSTTTRTGQTLARERFGAERVFYMPLDFAWVMRAYLRALRPSALVLMESELWPRMLRECQCSAIPVAVVNARVSDRSFHRALRVRSIWKHVLRRPSLWLAQSAEDARRLVAMGARPDTVQVVGNLKYDIRAPRQSRMAELIRDAAAERPIIVAGSTVEGTTDRDVEEELFLTTAYGGRLRNELNALLVIAPRHPERFASAWEIASEFPTLRATEILSGKKGEEAFVRVLAVGSHVSKVDIIVLDTIGDLAAVYGIADVAFVGGSLVNRGGHNPLEPAQFGVPVVMGPSFENFRDIVAKLQAANGIRIVRDVDELEAALVDLLTNSDAAKAMGDRGRRVFEEQQGATNRTVEALIVLIQTHKGEAR